MSSWFLIQATRRRPQFRVEPVSAPAFRLTRGKSGAAFTLIELLVSMAVLFLIMAAALAIIGQMSQVYKESAGKVAAFQDARLAFETMTRYLSQATLNTYTDYDNATNPTGYLRKSDLRFLSGPSGINGLPGTPSCGQDLFFDCPAGYTGTPATYAGMASLLNTCGYFVLFTTDPVIPSFLPGSVKTYRYRLMQLMVPTETPNSVYPSAPASTADWTTWFSTLDWFSNYTQSSPSSSYLTPIADNVIALIIRPQDPSNTSTTPPTSPDINPDYTYDTAKSATSYPQPVTANQLPPVIQVTMVAIDEGSSRVLQNGSTPPTAITQALNGKFTLATNYSEDLANLQTSLNSAHIKYQVFSSGVALLETKWSK